MSNRLKEIKIGMTVAGISLFSRAAAQRYLARALGEIPGLPAKAAQILGTKLNCNFEQPRPLCVEDAWKIVEERSPKLSKKISELRPALASASLGQVHEARLSDGTQVAIKIQLPEVKAQLQEQAERLLSLGRLSPANRYGLDWSDYESTIKDALSKEADYSLEAQNQKAFSNHFRDSDRVVIPTVLTELSSDSILVQSFEASQTIDSIGESESSARSEIASLVADVLWKPLLRPGLFHTDLHAKNLGVRCHPSQLVVYDFGSCMTVTAEQAKQFRNLVKATAKANESEIYDALVALGFHPKRLGLVRVALPRFAETLFGGAQTSESLSDLLGADKWWLRTAGPAWFMFAMRSFFHGRNIIARLNPSFDLIAFLKRELDVDFFQTNSTSPIIDSTLKLSAKTLHVRVKEFDEIIVDVQLPSRAIDNFDDLISLELRTKIEAQNLKLEEIRDRVARTHYAPQEIFRLKELNREYLVWLE